MIKSALILKKNLIATLPTIKSFLKPKSYGDEVAEFHGKDKPKVGSNHTCLALITIDSAHKKRRKLLSPSVFKRMQIY